MAACLFCGREFHPARSAKFCSAICRTEAWRKEHLPDGGPVVICAVCGQSFQAERRSAKYCGRACEGKAYRKRAFEWKRRVMMKGRPG